MIRQMVCLLLTFLGIGAQALSEQGGPCFTSIIKPGGWEIPKRGIAVKSGKLSRPGFPNGITFTDYALDPTKRIGLPRYYVEKGALVLMSLWFRSEVLTGLEVKGKTFGYLMYATGADIGSAGTMWWLDRDGDGTFTELQWYPDPKNLPVWVSKLLTSQ